mmetsp:Transcript_12650/g.30011  ORF Transcript_12650/g.30011 Transcript_12650/m.30011 type:complete len:122 (+) Transcript_12650:2012-2377(+)
MAAAGEPKPKGMALTQEEEEEGAAVPMAGGLPLHWTSVCLVEAPVEVVGRDARLLRDAVAGALVEASDRGVVQDTVGFQETPRPFQAAERLGEAANFVAAQLLQTRTVGEGLHFCLPSVIP